MQTIKVMRGGCVCAAADAASQKDLLAHGRTSVGPRGGGEGWGGLGRVGHPVT